MTFSNPLDHALIPENAAEWIAWYKEKKEANDILNEITNQPDGTLCKRVLPEKVIWYGHRIGALLAKKEKLKYSQLRRFVDALKEIDTVQDFDEKKTQLTLFQIQLIHGLSRQKNLEPFVTVIKGIIEDEKLIKEQADIERFMALVDSITAYFEILEEKSKNE